MVVFEQGSCIRAKLLYSGKKWLCSGKSGCIRAEEAVFVKKWLQSGKVVVFGQSGCIQECGCVRAKWFYSGKRSCIRA